MDDPVSPYSISPNGERIGGSSMSNSSLRPFRFIFDQQLECSWSVDLILGIAGFGGDVEAFGISGDGSSTGYGDDNSLGIVVRASSPGGSTGHTLQDTDDDPAKDGTGRAIAIYESVVSQTGCKDLNRVVGYYDASEAPRRAAIWGPYDTDEGTPMISAVNLPVADSFENSEAIAQSRWTQVVGYQDGQACLWMFTPGSDCVVPTSGWSSTMLPLSSGYVSSCALDITDTDTSASSTAWTDAIIVGYETDSQGIDRAVRWTYDAQQMTWVVTALSTSGTTSTRAVAVDLDGNIIWHDTYIVGQDEVTDSYVLDGATGTSYLFDDANVLGLADDESIVVTDLSDSHDRLIAVVTDPDATPTERTQRVVILEPGACRADFDGDLDVGFSDLVILLALWGDTSLFCRDLDGSGMVDHGDLVILLTDWGCGGGSQALPPDILDCLNASSDPQRQLDCLEALVETSGSGGGS